MIKPIAMEPTLDQKTSASQGTHASPAGRVQSPPTFQLKTGEEGDGTTTAPPSTAAPQAENALATPVNAQTTGTTNGIPDTERAVITNLLAEAPATNKDYALWVLKVVTDTGGVISFSSGIKGAKTSWEKLSTGEAVGKVKDPSAVLPILPATFSMIKAELQQYLDTGTKPKMTLGSFMDGRSDETHGNGNAIDINGFNFDAANPTDLFEFIKRLPSSVHELGLPAQGAFFDPTKSLEKAKADAEAAGTTDAVEGWVKYRGANYIATPTVTEDPATKAKKYVWEQTKDTGVKAYKKYFKSEDAKKAVEEVTTMVYPDNKNHVHVDAG